ncbi:MAG: transcription elongation factor GreA [bacterium]|nr:transcription elongation factor GreA [bacterium]
MSERIPITPEGLAKVKKELKHIKTIEVPQNIKDIETARAHGDLSENAEYHAAKERQSHLQGRLAELENIVALAQVINPSDLDHVKIYFGATVTLEDVDSGSTQTYQIVGVHESDVKDGKISVESPLAKKLLGKEEGDVVVMPKPKGNVEFEVAKVEYR